MEFSEQELQRRQAAEELRKLGINPYPAPTFDVNISSIEIKERFEKDENSLQNVKIAGRIMSRRIMGAVFSANCKMQRVEYSST